MSGVSVSGLQPAIAPPPAGPESAEERFERFGAAVAAAARLVDLLDGFKRRLERL